MKRIDARAPVRLDLAGGWTDVPPYTHDMGGEVVNVAINIHAHASLEIDDDGKLSVNYRCDAPVGSGLGTTGAINVALMAAIHGSDDAEGSKPACWSIVSGRCSVSCTDRSCTLMPDFS